jgi:hypothetical protein
MTVARPLRRGTETFNAHHLDGLSEVLADHVVFRAPGGMGDEESRAAGLEGGWSGFSARTGGVNPSKAGSLSWVGAPPIAGPDSREHTGTNRMEER